MALKNCIYCQSQISEYAVTCPNPKCGKAHPFDRAEKKVFDEEAKLKEKTDRVLQGVIACPECGAKVKVANVLKSLTRCATCGYPKLRIKCDLCDNNAGSYDPARENYVCEKHLIERCSSCGEATSGESKVISSSSYCGVHSRRVYHKQCTYEYQSQQKRNQRVLVFFLVVAGFVIWLMAR